MDYAPLDERIIEAIKAGKTSYSTIMASLNAGLSSRDPKYSEGRVVDRRLQFLRRKNLIKYTGSSTRSGWRLVEEVRP